MRRRELILLGGVAATWAFGARAQQPDRMRRVGVLNTLAADDPESQRRVTAFVQGLQELGWTDGRNVRIDHRWAAGDTERIRKYAVELVALAPDVILAPTAAVVGLVRRATRTVPIVFVQVIDPVGAGFVESLARPGGNATGFLAVVHRELIVTLAARHRLPAVYSNSLFVTGGGLISYGPDRIDQFRRAAGYVDRILKGAKPADLPVQAPVKYELVINLKTAKALGLDVQPMLLARADEVIE